MSTLQSLDLIEVQSPCKMDWEKMRGSNRQRYCEHCHLHVTDLAQLTDDEAQALICQNAGRLCLRISRLPDGTVLTANRIKTLNYQSGRDRRRFGWWLWSLIALLGAGIAAGTGWFRKAEPPPPLTKTGGQVMVTMGDICVTPTPPAPPAKR